MSDFILPFTGPGSTLTREQMEANARAIAQGRNLTGTYYAGYNGWDPQQFEGTQYAAPGQGQLANQLAYTNVDDAGNGVWNPTGYGSNRPTGHFFTDTQGNPFMQVGAGYGDRNEVRDWNQVRYDQDANGRGFGLVTDPNNMYQRETNFGRNLGLGMAGLIGASIFGPMLFGGEQAAGVGAAPWEVSDTGLLTLPGEGGGAGAGLGTGLEEAVAGGGSPFSGLSPNDPYGPYMDPTGSWTEAGGVNGGLFSGLGSTAQNLLTSALKNPLTTLGLFQTASGLLPHGGGGGGGSPSPSSKGGGSGDPTKVGRGTYVPNRFTQAQIQNYRHVGR